MTRQGDIWRGQPQRDLAERKAYVKARARYAETLSALSLDTELGDECPVCCGFALHACTDGRGAYCDNPACGETFDMIKLVMEKRDCGLKSAVDFLEAQVRAPRDTQTREMF